MDRTSIGDFKKPLLLFGRQWAAELNVSVDAIEQSLLCVAVSAICRIFSRMAQRDGDSFERPTLSASIHRHGHRSAGAESSKQKVIRTRARIGPSGFERFVGNKSVSPGDDFLGESPGAPAYNHIGFSDLFGLVFHRSRLAVSIGILRLRAQSDQPLQITPHSQGFFPFTWAIAARGAATSLITLSTVIGFNQINCTVYFRSRKNRKSLTNNLGLSFRRMKANTGVPLAGKIVMPKKKKKTSQRKGTLTGKSVCVRCDGRGQVCNVCGESETACRCEGELDLTECPDCRGCGK